MKPADREKFILQHLEMSGAVTYVNLAQQIGVVEMTVRRDIERLAKQGLVYKVLGGVQTASAPQNYYETEFSERLQRNAVEKKAIAQEALRFIEAQQTVFLDGGTTSLMLAKLLAKQKKSLSIVTNSVYVCLEFSQARHISVLNLGGKFDPNSGCLVGLTSEELAARYYVDIAFFSTKGLIATEGTFESNIATLRIKQIVAAQSGKNIVLVDHTKIGTRALCKVLDIRQLHEIITDEGTSRKTIREVEQHGPKVIVAFASASVGKR
jgi:DeoR/GlpR family transcriptional regulator of sugar metabolism